MKLERCPKCGGEMVVLVGDKETSCMTCKTRYLIVTEPKPKPAVAAEAVPAEQTAVIKPRKRISGEPAPAEQPATPAPPKASEEKVEPETEVPAVPAAPAEQLSTSDEGPPSVPEEAEEVGGGEEPVGEENVTEEKIVDEVAPEVKPEEAKPAEAPRTEPAPEEEAVAEPAATAPPAKPAEQAITPAPAPQTESQPVPATPASQPAATAPPEPTKPVEQPLPAPVPATPASQPAILAEPVAPALPQLQAEDYSSLSKKFIEMSTQAGKEKDGRFMAEAKVKDLSLEVARLREELAQALLAGEKARSDSVVALQETKAEAEQELVAVKAQRDGHLKLLCEGLAEGSGLFLLVKLQEVEAALHQARERADRAEQNSAEIQAEERRARQEVEADLQQARERADRAEQNSAEIQAKDRRARQEVESYSERMALEIANLREELGRVTKSSTPNPPVVGKPSAIPPPVKKRRWPW